MSDDDPLYKREEDRQWRDRTEERVVGLTSSEGVQNDRIADLEDDVETIKEMFEGKPSDKDDNGMKGDIHDLSVGLNELRRLMAPDHLGQGGVIARLHTLEDLSGLRVKRMEHRWQFWIAVVGFISAFAVAIITNLDRLEPFVKKAFRTTPPAVASPRKAKRRARPRPVTPPPIEEETPDESKPGSQQ